MFQYRKIIKESWLAAWKNKYLWFFGLFAALLGNSGEYEMVFSSSMGNPEEGFFPNLQALISTGIFKMQSLHNLLILLKQDPISVITLLVMLLILLALLGFLIWLSVISYGGLINNAACAISNKEHGFNTAVEAGTRKFWPVFAMSAALRVIMLLVFMLVSLPLVYSFNRAMAVGNILFGVLFLVLIPAVLCFSFVVKYAINYTVIKNEKLSDALRLGWTLFKKNWIITIEMALIMFFLTFISAFIVILLILVVGIPFVFLAKVASISGSFLSFISAMILYFLIFVGLVALSGAILSVFQTISWTRLFIELTGSGGVSKVERTAALLVVDKKPKVSE